MKATKIFAVFGLLLTLTAGNALTIRADDQPVPPPNPPAPDAPPPAPAPPPPPIPAPDAPPTPAPDAPPTPTPAAPAPNAPGAPPAAPAAPANPATPPTPTTPAAPAPDAPVAPTPAAPAAPATITPAAPAPQVPAAPGATTASVPAARKGTTQQQLTGRIVAVDRSHKNITLQVDNLTYVMEIADATRIADEGRERNMNDVVVGRYITATIMVRELTEGRVEVGVLGLELGKSAEAQGRARKRK